MRRSLPLVVLAVAGGCATLPPLAPSIPSQAVEHDPRSGTAEVGAVRITVHPDDWHGSPSWLDEYVTPVEIFVENGGAKEIAIRHDLFSLRLGNGFRYDALSAPEVRKLIGSAWYAGGASYWYYGAYGLYPWPGLYAPWRRYYYPYLWWGDPWFDAGMYYAPPALPPPLPKVQSVTTPKGTLAPGGRVSVLVFFPIPAEQLRAFTFQAEIRGADGARIGTLDLPFDRRAVEPPIARPPGPPPAAPPPPPPERAAPPAPPAPPAPAAEPAPPAAPAPPAPAPAP